MSKEWKRAPCHGETGLDLGFASREARVGEVGAGGARVALDAEGLVEALGIGRDALGGVVLALGRAAL